MSGIPRLSACGLALILGALAATGTGAATKRSQPALPVWPSPPAPARIAYVQSITGPADLGWRRSWGGRVVSFIVGDDRRAQHIKPAGVAVDDAGNILVADPDGGEIWSYDKDRRKLLQWDRLGPHRLQSPVAVARQGASCYAVDSALGGLLAFAPDGRLQWAVTNGLDRPSGLTLSGGRIYVAEAGAHRVTVFDEKGQRVAGFGQRGVGPGEFNFPTHLASMPDGRLLVTDAMNARVQIVGTDGSPGPILGSRGDASGHFNRPKGVASDRFGHIYVVDALFDNVQVFDATGRLLLDFGSAGSDPGQFWMPGGIAVSRDDRILVADTYNHRVQVFRYLDVP